MLQERKLYPIKQEDDTYRLPDCEDVVIFDEDFERDIAYDFYYDKIRINPRLIITNLYQSYLKIANRQVQNTGVKDKESIKTHMDVISYLYNNKVSFEEFVKALLPHEAIHQWTLGLSNSIEFIDEGLVESEARRISK